MTNNIEKLYELAGVGKYYLYTVKHLGKIHIAPLEGILENKHLFERNKKSKVKNTYINRVKNVYPPFTDTKQLNLIKWFSENIYCLELSHNGREFEFYTYSSEIRTRDKDFSQALASFFYYKWDDLTDEQREQIRKILE